MMTTSNSAPVHLLFAEQVRTHPDAIAMRDGAGTTTYGQLAAWSEAIAARLLAAGVRPRDRVAVCVRRGAYPATILAVAACGAVYVPVDAAYPAQRQRFILDDAAVTAIVRDESATLPESSLPQVAPSPDTSDLAPGGPTLPQVNAEDVAYLMYTSGSTGVPKGVLIEHRHIASLVLDDERLEIRPGQRVAMFAPVAFDASTFEIWGALCRGGELVVLDVAEGSIHELGAQLNAVRPDWFFLTSGLFHLLVDHDPEAIDSVGVLITGGDVLSPRHVRAAAARGTAVIYAAYGPTEATTFSSLHRVDPERPLANVPIGRPLRGRPMYVLDAEQQPVPAETIGEIYIGGSGVARGYHNRGELTAQRFVPDRFGGGEQTRLYRSGDLGMLRSDGEFEFHGRLDDQVKIRGHRVEPGEIEAELLGHPNVGGAAVIALEDGAGLKRLVAYVSPAPQQDLTIAEIRQWLIDRLPPYLLPTSFVVLDALPLNANGKPDRARLPYPWTRRALIAGLPPFRLPDTSRGRLIAQIWAEALDLDAVGADDDFYQLGGDSLQSVRVLAMLRDQGVTISAVDFFRHPTVGELASALDRTEPATAAATQ